MVEIMNSLGPNTKTTPSSRNASHRLMTDSRRMPLSMPDSTLNRAMPVMTMMMIDWTVELLGIPKTWLSPPLICSVPRPRDVASPKMVPNTARMSTMFPGQPKARSPIRGYRAEAGRRGRPLRKAK